MSVAVTWEKEGSTRAVENPSSCQQVSAGKWDALCQTETVNTIYLAVAQCTKGWKVIIQAAGNGEVRKQCKESCCDADETDVMEGFGLTWRIGVKEKWFDFLVELKWMALFPQSVHHSQAVISSEDYLALNWGSSAQEICPRWCSIGLKPLRLSNLRLTIWMFVRSSIRLCTV